MNNWDEKAFLRVNSMVNRNRALDAFGVAGAEWVIIAMLGWFSATVVVAYPAGGGDLLMPFFVLGIVWLVGFLLNRFISFIVRRPRPIVTLPLARTLFTPFSNKKSFPSDHAMAAFTIFFIAIIFHIPLAGALLPMALWVVWGRMFAGQHYPLDLLGGFLVSGLCCTLALYLIKIFC